MAEMCDIFDYRGGSILKMEDGTATVRSAENGAQPGKVYFNYRTFI